MEGIPSRDRHRYQSQPSPPLDHAEFIEIEEEDLDTEGLLVHLLGREATQSILSTNQPSTHAPTTLNLEASTLLQDLNRLAPSVGKLFTLRSTGIHDNLAFRLLNDFDNHHLDTGEDARTYIALSYCRDRIAQGVPKKQESGPGDLPFGWIKTTELSPLPVSEAMWQAVLRERELGEGLWFDQVCINQEDESEKATTIGAMNIIYSNARTVVITLDDISIPLDEALFFQDYLDQYNSADLFADHESKRGLNPPFLQRQPLLQSFFERILDSIWFERAWCALEMRMGRSHVFLVPCTPHDYDESFIFIRFTGGFFLHMLLLASELPTRQPTRLRTLLDVFARQSILDQRHAITLHDPSTKFPALPDPVSFVPLIAEIFTQKAGGNPRLPENLRRLDANRDRMSIALSSADLPLILKPQIPLQRPNIEDECLRQLLLVGLAARDPATLCTTGTPLQLHDGSISWLCRPTALDMPVSYPHRPLPRFSASVTPIEQGSDGRAEYVQLDLIFLDLPHRRQSNTFFPTYIQRARAVVELCVNYRVSSKQPMWNSWQSLETARKEGLRNCFVQTLACCFECGSDWTLGVSTSLSEEQSHHSTALQHETRRTKKPQQTLTQPMTDILCNPDLIIETYMRMPEGQHAFTLLVDFLARLLTRGIPWASGATERTHGPLIIRLPAPTSTSTSTSTYPIPTLPPHTHTNTHNHNQHECPPPTTTTTPPHKALIFAPFAHSKTLLVAVPHALTPSLYAPLSRAWILVPKMEYMASPQPRQAVSWTMQGKAVLFGGGTAGAGFERGLDLEGARVGKGKGERRWHRVFGGGGGGRIVGGRW